MTSVYNPALLAHPVPFVAAFPFLKEEHVKAQRAFFGAAGAAHLSDDAQKQYDGINSLLGVAITSRKQLTIAGYNALVLAIEEGAFNQNWGLTGRVKVSVQIFFEHGTCCDNCEERPVAYPWPGTEEGLCRECIVLDSPSERELQARDEDEQMALEVAAYKERLGIAPPAQAEFEAMHAEYQAALEREAERDRQLETALVPLRKEKRLLEITIENWRKTVNDPAAFHSAYQKANMRHQYYAAQGKLQKLINEYPFL